MVLFFAPFLESAKKSEDFLHLKNCLTIFVGKGAAVLQRRTELSLKALYKDLQHKSWLIFQEIKRKNISFVDCSILTVMRYMGIKKLLTFDTADFAGLRRKYSFNFYAK